MKSTIIDKEPVHRVVSRLLEADAAVEESSDAFAAGGSAIRVVDAFVVPKYRYDPIRKQFYEYVFSFPPKFPLFYWFSKKQ